MARAIESIAGNVKGSCNEPGSIGYGTRDRKEMLKFAARILKVVQSPREERVLGSLSVGPG